MRLGFASLAIFIRKDKSVVVVDGKTAHLKIDGVREALVDVAGAKFLGCVK